MLARIMKWISSVALLQMAVFSNDSGSYQLLFGFLVFMGAIVVLQQAIGAHKYLWAAGFVAIALVFNPIAPFFLASDNWFPLAALVCTSVFMLSLTALKTRPLLSMASITDRNPGSESL